MCSCAKSKPSKGHQAWSLQALLLVHQLNSAAIHTCKIYVYY